jgi:hypothetical protein
MAEILIFITILLNTKVRWQKKELIFLGYVARVDEMRNHLWELGI